MVTKPVYELAASLFPGAAFINVDYTERYSSERGPLTRLEVLVHWYPDAKTEDVQFTAGSAQEALAKLNAEAEVRAVKAKHGVG